MMGKKSAMFWIVTAFFVLAWVLAGTLSMLYISVRNVLISEVIIVLSSIVLILLYYLVEPHME